jgi:hypothetical protein
MKKLSAIFLILSLLITVNAYAAIDWYQTTNLMGGVIGTNPIGSSEGEDATFTGNLDTKSNAILPSCTNAKPCPIVVYDATCGSAWCANKEFITVKTITGSSNPYTFTIKARNADSDGPTCTSCAFAEGAKFDMVRPNMVDKQIENAVDACLTTVGVANMSSADFGSWTCNGSACTIDNGAIGIAQLASVDFGGFTCNGSTCTIDSDSAHSTFSTVTPATGACTNQVVTGVNGGSAPSCSSVSNAMMSNSSTTVNGQTCTLGSSCSVTDSSKQPSDQDLTDIAALTCTANQLPWKNGSNVWACETTDGSGDCASGAICLGDHTHSQYGVGDVTASSSNTFTNKTLDASATGNVLKMTGYIGFVAPHGGEGVGAVQQTDFTTAYFGQVLFSATADQTVNYVDYYWIVPADIDTSVDLTASWWFILGAVDTGKHRYVISMGSVANSANCSTATLSNAINLDFAGDGSGASGDIESVLNTTLTSWKSNVTANYCWHIRLARDGDDGTNDTSSAASYSGKLVISYGKTQ